MDGDRLDALAKRVETADEASTALADEVAAALRACFPEAAACIVQDVALIDSTDAVLHVLGAALPAAEVSITSTGTGRAPARRWRCSLRRTDAGDDAAVVGTGDAPTLSFALMAALLRAGARRD